MAQFNPSIKIRNNICNANLTVGYCDIPNNIFFVLKVPWIHKNPIARAVIRTTEIITLQKLPIA